MSSTLTYGLKRPDNGDLGSIWFANLRENITRSDGHTHDGTNSAPLTSSSITAEKTSLTSGDWGTVSGKLGLFSQTVNMPVGLDFDDYYVMFKDSSGDQLFLTAEKVGASGTSYDVFTNDSTTDVTALYVS